MEKNNNNNNSDNNNNNNNNNYRYWVRQVTDEAAPPPVPRKLSQHDISTQSQPSTQLGSVWNRAGTWEEKNLNKWASDRIKDLLVSVGSLEFSGGRAEIAEVSKCVGDAFLVTVRNKKRVGYNYELTLRVKDKEAIAIAIAYRFSTTTFKSKNGEWFIGEEKKNVKGHIDIPEFSFGELDDLQIEVRVSEEKDLLHQHKQQISRDLTKLFLEPLREKLLQFEQELKER